MTFENQMTALRRCTDISDIHFGQVGTKAKSEYYRKLRMNELVYSVGHEIYEIYCNETKKWYIGITKRGAEECRFKEHLDTVGCTVYDGMKAPTIKVVARCYGSVRGAMYFERNFILYYRRLYGEDCINVKNIVEKSLYIAPMKVVDFVIPTLTTRGTALIVKEGQSLMKKIRFGKIGEGAGMERALAYIKAKYPEGLYWYKREKMTAF